MSNRFVQVAKVTEVFRGSRCVGFVPRSDITLGDVLALQEPDTSAPTVIFTVESMQVNHRRRHTVLPGASCAVQIDPFPAHLVHKGLLVLKLMPEPKSETAPETGDAEGDDQLSCPTSPTGKHEWREGTLRPYQTSEVPTPACMHCGTLHPSALNWVAVNLKQRLDNLIMKRRPY